MTPRHLLSQSGRIQAAITLLVLTLGWTPRADADITRIVMTSIESPTFEGVSFGEVGQYEKIRMRAFGEVDPSDSRNAIITDVQLAPRNARGMVEYSMDVFILKPIVLLNGNHHLLYYVNNRGNLDSPLFPSVGVLSVFNDGSGGNDPTTTTHAGNGFLMRQGYTIVSSGWDAGVAPGGNRLTISVPVARNPDGSPLVGPSLEEFVIDNATTVTGGLTYPAATLDKTQATLTVRAHYDDPPVTIPATGWEYVNPRTIRLLPAGTSFTQGTLYEFTYLARDPIVAGLGFAATRDLAAFLRHADEDDFGQDNPLAGDVRAIHAFGVSQPARYMRDFLHLGFNEDEEGRPVFHGILNWVAGGSGIFLNYRFAQPARTHRQHFGRWYPEREFPFANQVLSDQITGKTDGRLRRCQANKTCPRIFEVNSSNEYWVKAASLLHTDTFGNDLPDPPNVRFYLLSSLAHSASTGRGICQQPGNPLVPNAGLRALLVALDQWVSEEKSPPAGRVPRRADGTLVSSLPQDAVRFPSIPGVTYNGLMTTGDLFHFGPLFGDGILTTLPPVFWARRIQRSCRGRTLMVMIAPASGYHRLLYRRQRTPGGACVPHAGDDLCDAFGQKLNFNQTKAERLAVGDPRPSIEERYPTHGAYVTAVARAASDLHRQRLLLGEDVDRIVQAAAETIVGK